MATFFRWRRFRPRRSWLPFSAGTIITATLAASGAGSASFTGYSVTPGVLAAAGAATNSDTGASTASTTNSTAGVGAASFVGAGVKTGALSSTGQASASFVGGAYYVVTFNFAGSGQFNGAAELKQIISTNMLQKPVDCVLAGDQDAESGKSPLDARKGYANYKALRGIFRE